MTRKNLFQNGLAFLICLFLFAGVSAQTTKTKAVQVTSSGTWTVPTTLDGHPITVTSVTFEAWGGGGAGGYAYSGILLRATGGGGGGAYAKSATITDMTPGENFTVTVGAGGTAIGDDDEHYTVIDGGMSTVYRASTELVKAVGGKSVSGVSNSSGAEGGNKSECYGPGGKASGGKGGNSDPGFLSSGAWCVSGSGGGAGGPGGDGGNAENSYFNDGGHLGQFTGNQGAGNGSLAGSGGRGWESQMIGSGGWGNSEGRPGGNYGGGGGGAISNGISWGDANGGAGGPGAILVTYTYVSQEISANNASATICSGTNFDIPLDITATGFDLANAHMTYGGSGTVPTGVNYSALVEFHTSDNKWHAVGNASNTNTETKAFALSCTVSTEDNSQTVPFTVTVNVYGRVDGGLISENQIVCQNQSIQTITSDANATGGSGNGIYKWYMSTDPGPTYGSSNYGPYEEIDNAIANAEYYTPEGEGAFRFKREYIDNVCGSSAFAHDADHTSRDYLDIMTVNPVSFYVPGGYGWEPLEDTICSNFAGTYYRQFGEGAQSPVWNYDINWCGIWQKSTDKGATWVNVSSCNTSVYQIYLTSSDVQPGDDIWYREARKFFGCDSIPSNVIFKIHVKEVPDYTGQFPDVNITLWYGACDTSIAALVPPVLTPTPASITRADSYGDRLTPGEYELRWNVIADDCNIPVEYTQNVKVEYPACGTLAEPLTMTDNDGIEYQTIRIGCECWMAENLRTNAPEAVYYNEDPANEQFGKLYTWADAVGCNETPKETMSGATYVQGILPDEWSIPTMAQYTKLLEYFNTEQLKSDASGSWLPDHLGTNESGFNLMGSGYYDVEFQRLRGYADLWVVGVTSSNPDKAPVAEFRYDCDGTINCVFVSKTAKMSVRGVRVSPK